MFEVSIDKKIALVKMNHGAENKWDPDFVGGFLEQLDKLEADKAVRVLIITGAQEKFFNTGLNLEWIMSNAMTGEVVDRFLFDMNKLYRRFCIYPKPMIAAINGHAFGNGCIMAAHMDFRVMRNDKGWISLPEVKINIPFLPGMLAIFKEVMPAGSFREMIYTGRKYSAEQAVELGLVDFAVSMDELISKSMEIAEELTKVNIDTYAEIKRRYRKNVVEVMDNEDGEKIQWMLDQMRSMFKK